MIIEIKQIFNAEELNILTDQKNSFDTMSFEFSEKYLASLKEVFLKGFQFFAEDSGQLAGYIASIESKRWPESLEIIELFVSQKYQGVGVGTRLVNKVIQIAKEFQKSAIVVQTEKENIPAQRLYEKLGFEKADNPNWEGITYRLDLA